MLSPEHVLKPIEEQAEEVLLALADVLRETSLAIGIAVLTEFTAITLKHSFALFEAERGVSPPDEVKRVVETLEELSRTLLQRAREVERREQEKPPC